MTERGTYSVQEVAVRSGTSKENVYRKVRTQGHVLGVKPLPITPLRFSRRLIDEAIDGQQTGGDAA